MTGASKGIGEACAVRLVGAGFRVFAGVRSADDGGLLRDRLGPLLSPVVLDVTIPDQIAAAGNRIAEAVGEEGLAGLVNNAGIAVAGPLEYLPIEALRRQIEVNVIGQIAVTQAVLPAIRRANGRIVFMSSISGRSALPFTGAYAASKFALEALADALRLELRPGGIEVSVVEPGVIATPIWHTSIATAERIAEDVADGMQVRYGTILEKIRRRALRGVHGRPPDAVARVVEHALTAARPRTRYLVGRDARIRLLIDRLLPTRARDALIARRLERL